MRPRAPISETTSYWDPHPRPSAMFISVHPNVTTSLSQHSVIIITLAKRARKTHTHTHTVSYTLFIHMWVYVCEDLTVMTFSALQLQKQHLPLPLVAWSHLVNELPSPHAEAGLLGTSQGHQSRHFQYSIKHQELAMILSKLYSRPSPPFTAAVVMFMPSAQKGEEMVGMLLTKSSSDKRPIIIYPQFCQWSIDGRGYPRHTYTHMHTCTYRGGRPLDTLTNTLYLDPAIFPNWWLVVLDIICDMIGFTKKEASRL